MMTNPSENKTQKHFVKDGDDNYIPRRPVKRLYTSVKQTYKKCECGGKLKPRGATDCNGNSSCKCNKCGDRVYTKIYKGRDGLAQCY